MDNITDVAPDKTPFRSKDVDFRPDSQPSVERLTELMTEATELADILGFDLTPRNPAPVREPRFQGIRSLASSVARIRKLRLRIVE